MPALSFSCPGCLPKIINGFKTTTIRRIRKRPIKVGDVLILYWKQRTPIKKKPVHRIGMVQCIDEKTGPLIEFLFDKEVAINDGFDSLQQMQDWFLAQVDDGLEQFQLIKWCHECMEVDPVVLGQFVLDRLDFNEEDD